MSLLVHHLQNMHAFLLCHLQLTGLILINLLSIYFPNKSLIFLYLSLFALLITSHFTDISLATYPWSLILRNSISSSINCCFFSWPVIWDLECVRPPAGTEPQSSSSSTCVCKPENLSVNCAPSISMARLWRIIAIVIHRQAATWSSFVLINTWRSHRDWNQPLSAPMVCSEQILQMSNISIKNSIDRNRGCWLLMNGDSPGCARISRINPSEFISFKKPVWVLVDSSTFKGTSVMGVMNQLSNNQFSILSNPVILSYFGSFRCLVLCTIL